MILFEIPIPFLADKVSNKISELNKEQFKENEANFSIKSISLGWNYSINRPVVLLKDVSYSQTNRIIKLSRIGFYPSLSSILKERKIYLKKVFLEGLRFIVTDDKLGYKIRLDDKNLIINKDSSKKESNEVGEKKQDSFLDKIKNTDNFKNGEYYKLISDLKKENSIFKYLNEFIIYKSNLIFINQQKRLLILDIDDLSLKEDNKKIFVNLDSNLTFDNDTDKYSRLSFNASINQNNIVQWDVSLNKILLSNVYQYLLKDKILQNLSLKGFEGTINSNGFYNTKLGLQDFNTVANIKQGSLIYKNYISTPLKVNNVSYKLFYDKKNNTLNIDKLDIDFTKNNVFSSSKLGLNILLNKLTAKLQYHFNDNSFKADNIEVFSGNNKVKLDVDFLPYSLEKQGFFKLNATSSDFDVNFVKLAWPKHYLTDIRKWIVSNISKGNIDNTNFKINLTLAKDNPKIDDLEGNVLLSDVELTYLKGLPVAQAKKVSVNYNINDVSIKYKNAITGGLTSSDGEVSFFNNSKNKNLYEAAMSLNLDASAPIDSALLFINSQPLNLLKDTGLNPSKFGGFAKGRIKLKYLFKDSKVYDKDINLKLAQTSLQDALPGLNVSNGNLNFLLNDSGLKINGILNALEEQVSTGIQINWENEKNIIQTYSVDVKNFPVEKLKQLSFLDKKVTDMLSGSIDGNYVYYKDSNIQKLSFYNDLSNALFFIDVFNYKSKIGEKLTIEGTSIFNNDNLKEIKNLKLNSSDLNINMNLRFDEKGELNNMLFNNFYIKNKASFKGNIDFSNNMKSFNLKGSLLDIAPILGYFRGENNMYSEVEDEPVENKEIPTRKKRGIVLRKDAKLEQEAKKEDTADTKLPDEDYLDKVNTDDTMLSDKVGNIRLKLSFNKIFNGDEAINNVYLNLFWEDNFLRLLTFSSTTDSSPDASYVVFDDKTSILGFRLQNLGGFLRLLEFPSNIKEGDLEGKVNIKKVISPKDKTKFYIASSGQFTLNNFSVGLNFASSYGVFRGKDLYFRLDKLELQGNLMGGNMQGFIDIKNRNLDIYGKLIPLWSANNLISNFPIFKPLFDNIPVAKNLIQINSRIRGSFDDIKYSIFTKDIKKGDVINKLNINNKEMAKINLRNNKKNNGKTKQTVIPKDNNKEENLPLTSE